MVSAADSEPASGVPTGSAAAIGATAIIAAAPATNKSAKFRDVGVMTNLLQRWTPLPSVPSSFPPNPQPLRSNSEIIYGQVINLTECEALQCSRRTEVIPSRHFIHRLGRWPRVLPDRKIPR